MKESRRMLTLSKTSCNWHRLLDHSEQVQDAFKFPYANRRCLKQQRSKERRLREPISRETFQSVVKLSTLIRSNLFPGRLCGCFVARLGLCGTPRWTVSFLYSGIKWRRSFARSRGSTWIVRESLWIGIRLTNRDSAHVCVCVDFLCGSLFIGGQFSSRET